MTDHGVAPPASHWDGVLTTAVVAFPFTAQCARFEMDLLEGETVTVLATRDDGWAVGVTGKGTMGLFPGNYLREDTTAGGRGNAE